MSVVALCLIIGGGLVSFAVGVAWMSLGCLLHSYEIWEIRLPDGSLTWVTDPNEVATALELDGMLAVRRLRVLT